MSYLLAQILICLLIAGLIGALIGWWLRGGCRRELREIDNDWSTKYDADKAVWQGKIDAAESHIEKSIHQNNDEWDLKLRDAELNWEGKVQGLVGNYDSELSNINLEKQALEDKLLAVRAEVKESRLELSSTNDSWDLKLRDLESNWEGKVQGLVSNYDLKVGNSDAELNTLKDKLATAETELLSVNDGWNLKLKDIESNWEGKVQGLVSNYDLKVGNSDTELNTLKDKLAAAETELLSVNDGWNLKLKDIESNWEGKVQGLVSNYDLKVGNSDTELDTLRADLKLAQTDVDQAKLKLTQTNDEWNFKLKDVESTWEGKVQSLVSDYDSKSGNSDTELNALKDELASAKAELVSTDEKWNLKLKDVELSWEDKLQGVVSDYDTKDNSSNDELKELREKLASTKMELTDVNDSWGVKLKDVESNWEGKIQGVVSDYDLKSGNLDQELQSLKDELAATRAEVKFSQQKLTDSDNVWNLKLKDAESNWEGKLQGVMSDYDLKISKADKEQQILKETLDSAQAEADVAKAELIQADQELFSAVGNLEECYDVEEIEGIGPGYGKRFRSMNVSTTCDFAERFLDNKSACEKASSETKIDLSAIQAWASMADLMKLPGVDGQYAEIMQVVGVSSRDELSRLNAKNLHSKMTEYNASNPIVPEVPSLELILKWMKSPDNSKIVAALETAPSIQDMNECYDIEEIEGIGPAYGKKLRNMGINTTCDLANSCLRDNRTTKKVSKKMQVDFDAIKAWSSMADLMRLPGVGGQFAEIMQTVGVSSRKELTQLSVNSLQSKMEEFNAKKPIVPEVPTVDMLVVWATAAKKH